MGHKDLYLDFAYLWILQKIVRERKEIRLANADQLYSQIKLLTRHRPEIESLYTLSCFVLALDYRRPELCELIAIDGMQAIPSSWIIPSIVGYMFTYRLHDPLRGAYYYKKASENPKCPLYIKQLSVKLFNKELDNNNGDETLRSIIEGTDDEDYRNFLSDYLNHRR